MVGRLTKDVDLRYTSGGTPVANFDIAINDKVKRDGEYQDVTLFMPVIVWGKQGESCSQYLSKGRQVLVEGRLQERRWEQDGQKRSKMECVASTVKFLGSKDEASSAPPEEHSGVEPF
jgi:single-strand DNA-binding protein